MHGTALTTLDLSLHIVPTRLYSDQTLISEVKDSNNGSGSCAIVLLTLSRWSGPNLS
jgi:hypothetical protein